MGEFAVPVARGPVVGAFSVPPSKSIHQRALVLAALSEEGVATTIATGANPPPVVAEDVVRLAGALSAILSRPVLPTGVIEGGVTPDGALGRSKASVRCDLGMNATGLRLLAAAAGLRVPGARTLLTGSPRLRARPHATLLRALTRLGAHAHRRPTGAIRVLGARWTRHDIAIAADRSSQPASALLLAAPRAGGLSLSLVGTPRSRGYLDLTESVLAAFHVPVSRSPRADGGERVAVPAASPRCERFLLEPDASSAAVGWAAAALTGGRVHVPGLPARSSQPDIAALALLERMGARVAIERHAGIDVAAVAGPTTGLLGAGAIDLSATPDLAPLVGALACAADGETRVVNAPHLRDKESDRIATTVAAIRAVGGDAEPTDDGFVVRGRGRAALVGGRVAVEGDHRIALAFGVLGLAVRGIILCGAEAVSKSFPGFLERLSAVAGSDRAGG